jgi:murein DD-endopeptidase MepM/ murein hydrolase activator NlpD
VIDHGLGVFSLYFHLDSITVSIGDRVEKGEKIGEVGSTGIAEGDHLHWSIFVNGIYVDPADWTKRVF